MKTFFSLTFSMDPYEMPHYVAFHLGLNCLYMWPFGFSRKQMVKSGSVPFLMISLDQDIEFRTVWIQIRLN